MPHLDPPDTSFGCSARRLDHLTDAQIMALAAKEPFAFSLIFNRHASALYRYLARRVDAAEAEDIVSETFALAFDQRDRYRAGYESARPWLFGIAINLLHRHERSECCRWRAYARVAAADSVEEVEELAVANGVAEGVRVQLSSALGKISAGDREALVLLAWGELSYEEIARALQIPVGTVRSRINRSRRALRGLLGEAVLTTAVSVCKPSARPR